MRQTALLAGPVYIGQAQGGGDKEILKNGATIELGPSLSSHLLGWHDLMLEDVFPLACQIKLSYNTEL